MAYTTYLYSQFVLLVLLFLHLISFVIFNIFYFVNLLKCFNYIELYPLSYKKTEREREKKWIE